MEPRKFIILIAIIFLCGTFAFGQDDPGRGRGRGPDDPPPPPPGRDGRDGRGGPPPPPRISPEERALQQLRQLFDSDDAEWSVLGPRIARIQTLTRERERLTHLKPPPPPRPDQQQPEDPMRNAFVVDIPPDMQRNPPIGQANIRLAQVFREMASLAANSSASASQLKNALEAFRAARVQAEKEIATARAELRDLVTPRQEVILVLSGILD